MAFQDAIYADKQSLINSNISITVKNISTIYV